MVGVVGKSVDVDVECGSVCGWEVVVVLCRGVCGKWVCGGKREIEEKMQWTCCRLCICL